VTPDAIQPRRSGVLPVDKGAGLTSFQVVAHLRRVLRAHKIGHGGTLDPAATGVLPILVGEATKLTPYLVDLDKEYLATVRLGVTTDTQDLSGAVLATSPVPAVDAADVEQALRALLDHGVPLRHLRIRPRNLEDLFLELTGRELRA